MPKFAIEYSPDKWNAPNGGVATQWTSPYGGIHVQAPADTIGPQFSPDMNNIMLRNAQLLSRPAFKQLLPGPDTSNFILGCGSFLSNAQVWHTFCMTPRGLWQLLPNAFDVAIKGKSPWVALGGPPLSTAPVSWSSYAGILYYSNGTHLSAWDGQSSAPLVDVAFTGSTNPPPTSATVFGGVFVAELDNRILLAYVNETTNGSLSRFANRVRWSNSGFNPISSGGVFGANLGTTGATFDPTVFVGAGSNDFLDCPDIITGLMTLGRDGYVFRQNGITHMSPTGRGAAPFDFNHLWASQNGVGNVYPFSIAQYGNMGVFISFEQIYQITPGGMKDIGGSARDSIMQDLASATGSPKASFDRGFQLGVPYLIYHLRIPTGTGTKSWIYSIEDAHWFPWTTTGVWPTGTPNECWV
jgi:hypothetical protein